MGKVRKLRKKYKALCSKSVTISKPSVSKKKPKTSISPAKASTDRVHVRSDKSVFKSRKNELLKDTNTTTTTIDIRAKKNFITRGKNSEQVLQSDDGWPLSKKQTGRKTFNKRMKNRPRKQATKIRHNNLIQDIDVFKRTLKEESFLKNPQTAVMNQTLERLSAECSFNSKEKVKNARTS